MKRRLLIIAIFLLLGAVVNVAVAWGCAVWLRLENDDKVGRFYAAEAAPTWIYDVFDRSGHRTVLVMLVRHQSWVIEGLRSPAHAIGTPAPQSWVSELDQEDYLRHNKGITRFSAYGWPCHSLWCGFRVLYDDFPLPPLKHFGAIPVPDFAAKIVPSWLDRRALPLRPIWSGFAVNTIFYATLLWLLIPGPFVLRRFLRVRRGLCPKCAYPMGESAVCTECGCGLPKRARTT